MLIVAWGYFGWPVWEMGDLPPVLLTPVLPVLDPGIPKNLGESILRILIQIMDLVGIGNF